MSTKLNAHLGNIFQIYACADRWDKAQGLHAYSNYHKILKELGVKYGYDTTTTCAVFATISPNTSYISNLRSTEIMFRAYKDSGTSLESLSLPIYKNNQRKAWSILEGEAPLDVITAPKTRSFFLNLADPADPKPITIDGHMYSVWSLTRYKLKEMPDFDYEQVAKDFRHCAKLLGLIPNQLQAICWFTWRRLYNLFTDLQPSLFDDFELR